MSGTVHEKNVTRFAMTTYQSLLMTLVAIKSHGIQKNLKNKVFDIIKIRTVY